MGNVFFRLHRNKIFAIAFCSVALLCLFARYVLFGVVYGWSAFASSPWNIINMLLMVFVFGMLLVTNIQNDNRAYVAISFFVFYNAWDALMGLLPLQGGSIWAYSSSSLFPLALLCTFLCSGLLGLGVCFYIFLFRYRMARCSFKLLWLFAVFFVASLALYGLATVTLYLLGSVLTPTYVAYLVLGFLPEVLLGVGALFTLLRLKRI